MTNNKTPNKDKVINTLFDSLKDFIVIGLCGKNGSGSSEAAKILQIPKFDELKLPPSNPEDHSLYSEQEYKLIYTFASKNWECSCEENTANPNEKTSGGFYKIKTSALITAHILDNNLGEFVDFLLEILKKDDANTIDDGTEKKLRKICGKFFNERMEFSVDEKFLTGKDDKGKDKFTIKHSNKTIPYIYSTGEKKITIKNTDLYKMFKSYGEIRRKKLEFSNGEDSGKLAADSGDASSSKLFFEILKKYIYEFLPDHSSNLWRKISSQIDKGLPTIAMQILGINLRVSKKPYITKEDIEKGADKIKQKDGYLIIAEDINLAIKLLRGYNTQHKKEPTRVVIDSIKNPFESMYLKQRYSNYYLIGIYTEDDERYARLQEAKNLSLQEIKKIDTIEQLSEFKKDLKRYHKKEKTVVNKLLFENILATSSGNDLPFIMQNVASCLDSADIFINNKRDNRRHLHLKVSLLRYVSLIMYPGLVLPTHLERCMQIAYTTKLNSGCISRQVGAIITDKDFHLLSVGWNQQPEDQLPCSYRGLDELNNDWNPDAFSDYEKDDNDFLGKIGKNIKDNYDNSPLSEVGRLPVYCFKDIHNAIEGDKNQVHPRSLHAEETAFLNLGPTGKAFANGGCLFTTSSPCELCAKKAKYMGISKIYYVEPYSGISYKHVLSAGPKETRPEFILLTGAVGRAYMQLYTPVLPLKDEHALWMESKTEDLIVKEAEKNNGRNQGGGTPSSAISKNTAGAQGNTQYGTPTDTQDGVQSSVLIEKEEQQNDQNS